MIKVLSASLIAAAVLLSACSAKNEANEKNFASTISENLERDGLLCIGPTLGGRPLDFPSVYWNSFFSEQSEAPTSTRLVALEKAGFIERSPGTGLMVVKDGTVFRLTEAGRKIATDIPESEPFSRVDNGKTAAFCYGKQVLDKVINWDTPDQIAHETAVRYTYKVILLEPWASNQALAAQFPEIAESEKTAGLQASAILDQTSDGWRYRGQ